MTSEHIDSYYTRTANPAPVRPTLDGEIETDVFGGHGMGTTTMAGELVASAIAEGDERSKLFAPFGPDWTGGPVGLLAAEAIYRWYRFRDWLKG